MGYGWKKGILVVSFGTRHINTITKTIGVIEEEIKKAFPAYCIYRAFINKSVLQKLREQAHMEIDSVQEALKRMETDGVTDVVIQPTMIINGIETEQMLEEIKLYKDRFQSFYVGAPLLNQVDDYKKAVHCIIEDSKLKKEDILVLIGHGTDHHANAAYPTLEYTFHALGYTNVFVGTIGEFPGIRHVLVKMEVRKPEHVYLMPFFLVLGEHVRRQVMGEEDSWEQQLITAGYAVTVIGKGLGEVDGIARIFITHIEDAIQ